MRLRPVRKPDDLTALDDLFRRCRNADGHWPLGEHEYLDLVRGDVAQSVGLVFEDDDGIVGYTHLTPAAPGEIRLGMAVDPMKRSDEVVGALVEAAMDEAKRRGAHRLRFWVYQPAMAGILVHHGFVLERELRQLRCDLPADPVPPLPEGFERRPFVVGRDEETWLQVNNRAFAGHPENGMWTAEILAERQRQPWFDPEGFIMVWQGEALAGFCWTKVHPDDLGEIYVIAVDPAFQGRGLGRYLVLAGLDHLYARRGCRNGMLYVDASNERALALYTAMGFWMDHVDRAFVVDL